MRYSLATVLTYLRRRDDNVAWNYDETCCHLPRGTFFVYNVVHVFKLKYSLKWRFLSVQRLVLLLAQPPRLHQLAYLDLQLPLPRPQVLVNEFWNRLRAK